METIYEIQTLKVSLQVAESRKSKTNSSAAAVAILRGIYKNLDADQEHFCLLALDNKCHVRGYKVIFSGGMVGSLVDLKVLFRTALFLGAVHIIVAHNHPTGDPEPSPQDHQVTEQIARAAQFLNMSFKDHIILGGRKWFSFFDRGLLKADVWDKGRICYHRFGEQILEEIRQLLPLTDPVTERRIRRLLRDRGASATDWKRLKLSKSEELRIKKEALLTEIAASLREAEDLEAFNALRAAVKTDSVNVESLRAPA